jgi:hypothetical protein
MDPQRFDSLVKSLSVAGTRRGLVRRLAALPLWMMVIALLATAPESTAKKKRKQKSDDDHGSSHRRQRRKARHDAGKDKENRTGKRKGDKKDECAKSGQSRKPGNPCCEGLTEDAAGQCVVPSSPPSCVPETVATTCAGQCGKVGNNCGQFVTCAPCTCDPSCAFCQRCDELTDDCEPDLAKVGMSCAECAQCAGDGTCQPCAHECCATQCCADPAAICHVTEDACCVPETVAATCTGQCGMVPNNCGQLIDCTAACSGCCDGSACVPVDSQTDGQCGTGTSGAACAACPECQTCGGGQCVPDLAMRGLACGAQGNVCKADGTCAPNSPPTAVNNFFTGDEGTQCLQINLIGNDEDGQPLTFKVKTLPSDGDLFTYDPDQPDGGVGQPILLDTPMAAEVASPPHITLCYAPDDAFHGDDSFTYTATDTFGAESVPATISITLNDINL